MLKIHDWVDIDKIDFETVAFNPNVMSLLSQTNELKIERLNKKNNI